MHAGRTLKLQITKPQGVKPLPKQDKKPASPPTVPIPRTSLAKPVLKPNIKTVALNFMHIPKTIDPKYRQQSN